MVHFQTPRYIFIFKSMRCAIEVPDPFDPQFQWTLTLMPFEAPVSSARPT